MIAVSYAVAELKGEINSGAHTLLTEFSRAFSASFSGSSGTSSLSKVTLIFCSVWAFPPISLWGIALGGFRVQMKHFL